MRQSPEDRQRSHILHIGSFPKRRCVRQRFDCEAPASIRKMVSWKSLLFFKQEGTPVCATGLTGLEGTAASLFVFSESERQEIVIAIAQSRGFHKAWWKKINKVGDLYRISDGEIEKNPLMRLNLYRSGDEIDCKQVKKSWNGGNEVEEEEGFVRYERCRAREVEAQTK